MRHHRFLPLFLLCFFAFCSHLSAQETDIRIRVSAANGEGVGFATLTVLGMPDTAHQLQKVADSSGTAVFSLKTGKSYLVRFSSAGYQPFEKSLLVKADHPLYSFTAQLQSKALNNVVVTATRPLMRQEDDKTIVDPENLAAVSTNAYEILEKTPGLFVDPDGNIYLTSTTPATVYINGREQKMSAADIATLLKNLPPNAIASIEIMRTPSAKYDASGSGGIVNVVLKKGVRIGLTGSVTAGGNQGKYGNRFIGINLNNNNGSLTTYLNMQYGKRNNYEQIRTDRLFAVDSILSQDARTKYTTDNYYIGFGFNYLLTKKWELSYDGRVNYSSNDNYSRNYSRVLKQSTGGVAGGGEIDVRNKGYNLNMTHGVNLRYKIDSVGSEWTTDISYSISPNNTTQTFTTGDGQLDNRLHFFTAQTNLVKKLKGKITFETGLKTSDVRFRNNTDYFKGIGSARVQDNVRTGAYTYSEGIHSAYLQASKSFSGTVLKVGTRLENTNMKGTQLAPGDTSFSIHRTDLFPYIYLSRTIMRIAGYDLRAYLVYRRTISRPAYEYLNPSLRFIDPFLYETGNPSLRPQFTKNYEANISVDERPLVAVGINDTKDIFTQVVYTADTNSKVSLRTYDNLGSNKETYIRLLGAIPPGKRYFAVLGAQYNHNFYEGLYEGKPLSFKKGTWTFFTFHQFKLTSLTQLSMSGFVRFNGQQQFYELSNFGELRASISQQFLKKKLNITLNASDLLGTNHNDFTINQGSVHASGTRQNDTQRFGINIRYNFGIRKKEENNPFNVDSPDK